MKIYADKLYSFIEVSSNSKLLDASAIIFSELSEYIKQAKINKPNLILINIVSSINWEYIFQQKIHLTIYPDGDNFTVVTLDGASYQINKADLQSLISKLLQAQYYKTEIVPYLNAAIDEEMKEIIQTYPQYKQANQNFGTFAIRIKSGGFITSTRGKKTGLRTVAYVAQVNHQTLTVYANQKATLNAPLLDKLLTDNPHINYLIHGHDLIGKQVHNEYEFAGTTGDLKNSTKLNSGELIYLPFHGYIVGFSTFSETTDYIKSCIWNDYRNKFPERYFQMGKFDEELKHIVQEKCGQSLKVLDIGGGEKGTEILNQPNWNIYFLDPYILKMPDWMKGRVDWDTSEKFDLIVARGCINYFTPKQLSVIAKLLKPQGLFLANSFKNPPGLEWVEKKVENNLGVSGIERSRLVGDKVEHQIVFPNYQVNHWFYYYSMQDFKSQLPSVEFECYGKNSIILKLIS